MLLGRSDQSVLGKATVRPAGIQTSNGFAAEPRRANFEARSLQGKKATGKLIACLQRDRRAEIVDARPQARVPGHGSHSPVAPAAARPAAAPDRGRSRPSAAERPPDLRIACRERACAGRHDDRNPGLIPIPHNLMSTNRERSVPEIRGGPFL